MAELIIIRGLPGSGKSTLAKQIMRSRWPTLTFHFEADMFHYDEKGNYNWNPGRLKEAHEWCRNSCAETLAAGRVVIVSNTFTTEKELRPYFEMAKGFGIVPIVYHSENQFGNIHNVPDEAIERMKARWCNDLTNLFNYLGNDNVTE